MRRLGRWMMSPSAAYVALSILEVGFVAVLLALAPLWVTAVAVGSFVIGCWDFLLYSEARAERDERQRAHMG